MENWSENLLLVTTVLAVFHGIQAQCGSTSLFQPLVLTSTIQPQNVTSPGYENHTYPDNSDCHWRLAAPSASDHVCLTVLELDIEYYRVCTTADYFTIFNGPAAVNALLYVTLCGKHSPDSLPNNYCSDRQNLMIKFHSDGSTSRGGFVLQFWTFSNTTTSTPAVESTTITDSPITNHTGSTTTTMTTVNTTQTSPTTTTTTTTATTTAATITTTRTTTMAMGATTTTKALISDTTPSPLTSIEGQCSGVTQVLTSNYYPQNMASPGYDNNTYPLSTDCHWQLAAPSGSDHVCLTILEFKIEFNPVCTSADYVVIYDGPNTTAISSTETGSSFQGSITPDNFNMSKPRENLPNKLDTKTIVIIAVVLVTLFILSLPLCFLFYKKKCNKVTPDAENVWSNPTDRPAAGCRVNGSTVRSSSHAYVGSSSQIGEIRSRSVSPISQNQGADSTKEAEEQNIKEPTGGGNIKCLNSTEGENSGSTGRPIMEEAEEYKKEAETKDDSPLSEEKNIENPPTQCLEEQTGNLSQTPPHGTVIPNRGCLPQPSSEIPVDHNITDNTNTGDKQSPLHTHSNDNHNDFPITEDRVDDDNATEDSIRADNSMEDKGTTDNAMEDNTTAISSTGIGSSFQGSITPDDFNMSKPRENISNKLDTKTIVIIASESLNHQPNPPVELTTPRPQSPISSSHMADGFHPSGPPRDADPASSNIDPTVLVPIKESVHGSHKKRIKDKRKKKKEKKSRSNENSDSTTCPPDCLEKQREETNLQNDNNQLGDHTEGPVTVGEHVPSPTEMQERRESPTPGPSMEEATPAKTSPKERRHKHHKKSKKKKREEREMNTSSLDAPKPAESEPQNTAASRGKTSSQHSDDPPQVVESAQQAPSANATVEQNHEQQNHISPRQEEQNHISPRQEVQNHISPRQEEHISPRQEEQNHISTRQEEQPNHVLGESHLEHSPTDEGVSHAVATRRPAEQTENSRSTVPLETVLSVTQLVRLSERVMNCYDEVRTVDKVIWTLQTSMNKQ